jgi:hypothetical protein
MTETPIPVGSPVICPVCGKNLGNQKIQLRKHLQLEKATDWKLCEKDQKLFDEGFVAMIEVFNPKQTVISDGKLLEQDAARTGRIYHLRRALAQDFFQAPIDPAWPLCYVSNKDKNGKDMMEALSLWVAKVYTDPKSLIEK